jgi:Ca-activated chloride channel homolog
MKRFSLSVLIFLSLVSILFAQSDTSTKIPPTDMPSGNSTQTDSSTKATELVGYSETLPSEPLSIWLPRRRKKSNDNRKKNTKETKVKTPNPNDSGEEVIKVDTTLISVPVTVSQKNGLYTPSLSKQNFQIFEDGKEQETAYFSSTDKPFTVILLLDLSGSTSLKIEQIQDGALAFVKQLMPEDKVAIISFESSLNTLLEFSSDRVAIEKAIRKIEFGGETSLYEAVDKSLNKKFDKIKGKKAIVLFTDGVDTSSGRASYESNISDAVESEVAIFPIYLDTYIYRTGIGGPMSTIGIPGMGSGQVRQVKEQYAVGRRYLQDLATATGGRVFKPENSEISLTKAFAGVAEELRSQYEVGYYSNNESTSGDVKHIKIRVSRPNLVIRNRDSYVVK